MLPLSIFFSQTNKIRTRNINKFQYSVDSILAKLNYHRITILRGIPNVKIFLICDLPNVISQTIKQRYIRHKGRWLMVQVVCIAPGCVPDLCYTVLLTTLYSYLLLPGMEKHIYPVSPLSPCSTKFPLFMRFTIGKVYSRSG